MVDRRANSGPRRPREVTVGGNRRRDRGLLSHGPLPGSHDQASGGHILHRDDRRGRGESRGTPSGEGESENGSDREPGTWGTGGPGGLGHVTRVGASRSRARPRQWLAGGSLPESQASVEQWRRQGPQPQHGCRSLAKR